MPISDEALQKEKNRFIAVKGEATLGQVAGVLTDLGGQPWWHVVVQMDDGSWGVARFNELLASIGGTAPAAAAEIQLRALKRLASAAVVERALIEPKAAQALARKNPAHVLVVTENGRPVGILVEGAKRGAAPDAMVVPSMGVDQLGGKYVKLKDYGSILLGSSSKRASE